MLCNPFRKIVIEFTWNIIYITNINLPWPSNAKSFHILVQYINFENEIFILSRYACILAPGAGDGFDISYLCTFYRF